MRLQGLAIMGLGFGACGSKAYRMNSDLQSTSCVHVLGSGFRGQGFGFGGLQGLEQVARTAEPGYKACRVCCLFEGGSRDEPTPSKSKQPV